VQGQAFKGWQFAAEVILWAVRGCLMFPISCRSLEPMLQDRGVGRPHDDFPLDPGLCARAGEAHPAPSAADQRLVAGGQECAAASGVRDGGRPPQSACRSSLQTTVSSVVKSPGRERYGKGAARQRGARIRPVAPETGPE
jgi:hypothetical protein